MKPPHVELQPPPTRPPSAAAPRQPSSSQFHGNTSSCNTQLLLHRNPTRTCGCCTRVPGVTAHAASSQMRLPKDVTCHTPSRAAVALCTAPASFWAGSSSCAAPQRGPRVQAHQQGRACSKSGYAQSSRIASHARATTGHAQGVTPCSASSRPRRICCSGSATTATRW
jgi:hypothetical protein